MAAKSQTLSERLTPYRTISIIGMAKNVGKTTTLNYLIHEFAKSNTILALTSIGRDGESTDIVTKTKKPTIFVRKGTLIATAEKLIGLCDITKEILLVTEFNTPMGRIVIMRALSDGFVQLGGPSITSQMADLLVYFEKLGADKVFVDGALNRKTLANPSVTEATLLCTGASLDPSIHTVIEETQHLVSLLTLPKLEEEQILAELAHVSDEKVTQQEGYIYIRGAVSDAFVNSLIMSGTHLKGIYLIAEDASKIFIKPTTYKKLLMKKAVLSVINPIQLVGLTINPRSPYEMNFDAAEFLEKLREAVSIPVYNVRNEYKEAVHV